jgi:uncharacterized membrane protein HdeD (DUF308 family)
VAEQPFHHIILTMVGVAGMLWFFGALNSRNVWSWRRRVLLGILSGLIFLTQALGAFTSSSSASSLELFGFIGCTLGCLGAVRIKSWLRKTGQADKW